VHTLSGSRLDDSRGREWVVSLLIIKVSLDDFRGIQVHYYATFITKDAVISESFVVNFVDFKRVRVPQPLENAGIIGKIVVGLVPFIFVGAFGNRPDFDKTEASGSDFLVDFWVTLVRNARKVFIYDVPI